MVTATDDAAAGGGGGRLAGLRILVVEDETVVSMLLEDMLAELGCEVVGPAARLGRALELAKTGAFDLAVLDVNLAGEEVYPVADALAVRGLPFVFATGYGKGGVRGAYRDRPTVQKPFQQPHLRRALADALAGGGGAQGT